MTYYRRDGSTFEDHEEAARLLADIDYRRVAQDEGDGWSVSTVFLVIPHPPFRNGYPSLYESLIHTAGDDDGAIWRYPNEVAALAGHDQAVAQCRARV